ncbi:MAG: hypothetical protein C0601_07880 [Candidatus Muiribacterium halophilum]|uniref:Transglutaminase-like domain-containing protein n=1 Tax=Muiribacterium halophilum TaxID=2053465 RepID=A0A2N5ZF93_MUIH1|nr:MAG: hypothetical protein C0601_07880 [Candidatus Muirbacterium halophilum]
MKKTRLFLLLSLFIVSSVFALRLDYYDGHTEHTDSLYYQKGYFGFNGRQVNRDEIKGVRFVIEKKKEQSEKAAPAKVAEAKPLEKDMFWIFKKANEMQKKYPDASGLILWDRGGYYLKKDGSRVYRYHFLGKILKEDTKGWGELSYGIEEGRDKVDFVKARSITSDGKYYSFDPASVKESVPSDSSSSLSKNRKIKNASIPNAEVGTFVEYIIEKTTYNPFKKDFFFPSFGFLSSEPVMLSEFTVQVPEDVKLNYVYRNIPDGFTPEVKYDKGMKTYVWTMKDVDPMISEPYSPGYYEIAPVIKCSTLSSWDEFLKWEKGFLEERVVATDYVKEKTHEIVKGAKTKEEQLAKIYHWLQQNIRYLSIKSGIGSGWSGHKAEITLKNKFGDCIDKAILFSAMGKVIGVKIVPIGLLTNTTYKAEYRIPQFNNNHAIVKVYLDGKSFFLDTTSENYRYPYFRDDDHGVQVHNPLEEKIDYIPLPDPKD